LVEHEKEQVIGTRQMEPLSELEGQVLVVRDEVDRVDVWNQIVLLNIDREDLTGSVDHDHSIGVCISR